MRHAICSVGNMQREVERRHASLRRDILDAISTGTTYPWTLLAGLYSNKFYADIVESLLGAVWVDSGSIDTCKQLLTRMGILPYLHRLVQDRVHILHPREELGILADNKEVEYDVQLQNTDDETRKWTCAVSVGGTQVSKVYDGVSDDEVRTRAAEIAVSSLRSTNGVLESPIEYGKRIIRCRQV